MLADNNLTALHPLSELDHPIIRKAMESVGTDAADDNVVGGIASSTHLTLLEIRSSQWRGAIWRDPESGVHWLLAAGLAKGEHRDHDDFYERVRRTNTSGAIREWLPTEHDHTLLKQETAARLLTQWEFDVQRVVLDGLTAVQRGGTTRVGLPHPLRTQAPLGFLALEVVQVREPDYQADEVEVEFKLDRSLSGSSMEWQVTLRVLTTISPPEQGWDRFGNSYSNIGEPGAWQLRTEVLAALVDSGELAQSEPGTHAHYTHTAHIAGSTINGTGMRALCGVFFVPRQDFQTLPACPSCAEVVPHAERLTAALRRSST